MLNNAVRITSLLFLCFTLAACGYHLRGSVSYSIERLYIIADSAPNTGREVRRILQEEGVSIVDKKADAQAVLFLRNEAINGRVLSVSAVSGRLEEVELNAILELEAQKPDGQVLLEARTIRLVRDYSFDETAVLAKDSEERVLREELSRDVVAQVIRSVQAIKLNN